MAQGLRFRVHFKSHDLERGEACTFWRVFSGRTEKEKMSKTEEIVRSCHMAVLS